jgi:hypothetical protein
MSNKQNNKGLREFIHCSSVAVVQACFWLFNVDIVQRTSMNVTTALGFLPLQMFTTFFSCTSTKGYFAMLLLQHVFSKMSKEDSRKLFLFAVQVE